jgi:hypothetical protein
LCGIDRVTGRKPEVSKQRNQAVSVRHISLSQTAGRNKLEIFFFLPYTNLKGGFS